MKRPIHIFALAVLVLAGAMTAFAYRSEIREAIEEARAPELPAPKPFAPTEEVQEEDPDGEEADAPAGVREEESADAPQDTSVIEHGIAPDPSFYEGATNLAVPFSSQAPHADWSLPYQEACEETSLIMVDAWIGGEPAGLMDPDDVTARILEVVAWQEQRFGYYEDTTAEETAEIAREFYGYAGTEVLPVRTIEDVKAQLSAGYAVILPASGRDLHNPYFSGEGPLYHMLVAKGYTEDGRIITNDPGTRRGADHIYDPKTLFMAIGDWNGGDPANGAKLMIVVKP